MSEWPSITVRFRDVADRRAFIRFPPEAKVKLAHMAGAPWSEVNPDAQLSDEQQDVLRRKERTGVIEGGTGLGKSMMAGIEAGVALMVPFDRVAMVGDRFDHVGKEFRYTHKFLLGLFAGHMSAFKRIANTHRQNYHDYDASPIWGSVFIPMSMDQDQGAQALGEFCHMVILCEGSQISVRVLNTKILRAADRALQRRRHCESDVRETGHIRAYTTPDGAEGAAAEMVELAKAHTQQDLAKLAYGRVPFAESMFHVVAASTMNPQFSQQAMDHRRKTMTQHDFDEVYRGIASPASGRVYPLMQRHIRAYPPAELLGSMRLGVGLDTGATLAAVLVGIDSQKRGWALAEHYGKKQAFADNAGGIEDMLLEALAPLGIRTIEEASARLDLCCWDKSSHFKVDVMERWPSMPWTDAHRDEGAFELLPTIDMMRDWLSSEFLYVVESCYEGLNEFRKYIWQSRPSPARKGYFVERKPIDDFNHWLDAWRYITIPLMQLGPLQETPRSVESLAQDWNRSIAEQAFGDLSRILQDAEEQGGIRV